MVMKSVQRNLSTSQELAGSRGTPGIRTDDAYARALQRVQTKQEIVAQLIAGRFSLLEAASRFRAASQPAAEGQDGDEHLCRTLIGWAYLALCEYPERAEAVSDRLETDLQEILDRQGFVCLPG
jgi:hypothetical protein